MNRTELEGAKDELPPTFGCLDLGAGAEYLHSYSWALEGLEPQEGSEELEPELTGEGRPHPREGLNLTTSANKTSGKFQTRQTQEGHHLYPRPQLLKLS